jgi:hypothetical protein
MIKSMDKGDSPDNNIKLCGKCKGRNWLIECSCRGKCGQVIFYRDIQYKFRKFVKGHSRIGRNKPLIIRFEGHGYLSIYQPSHYFANNKGRIRLHRFVYEYFNKVCLLPWTDIHHINGKKTDNHKRNLMAVSRPDHRRIHMIGSKINKKDMSGRVCLLCGSDKTWISKEGWHVWSRHNDGFVCSKCHDILRGKTKKIIGNSPPQKITDKYISVL